MVRVFCDFDGTVCPEDIGEQFFRTFAGKKAEGSGKEFQPGKFTGRNWLEQLPEAVPSVSREEFIKYVERFNVDPCFGRFVRFAEEKNIELMILSDGLDTYIENVLSRSGMEKIRFFANHVEFLKNGSEDKMKVSFPYTDAECDLCGNCKRNHMLCSSADDDIIVYAGDGYSDQCPVRYADFVFAKGSLKRYCQQMNITFFEFTDFSDVQTRLEKILMRKRIRHRQEAEYARREVFIQE